MLQIELNAWPYYLPTNQGLYDTGQIMWDFLSRFTNEPSASEPSI